MSELALNGPGEPDQPAVGAPVRGRVKSNDGNYTQSLTRLGSPAPTPNRKLFDRLIHKANRVSEQGNAVRAALLRLKAARHAPAGNRGKPRSRQWANSNSSARRLQAALGFDDGEAAAWRDVMISLLAKSSQGFWNADKRLLYDLQKVCIDHEREISHLDLGGWIRSFGRQPIRRMLPNQREVRINKHLRRATSRLMAIRLSGLEREQLNHLLHEAAHKVEIQLRERLRPLMSKALDEVGLEPENLPERVSRRKIIEELLDKIVHHGFLNMSMLRDAISRNNLKMPDLASPLELWTGDWLLEADRRLKVLLDGVYRRGEFYLRGLQKVSSVAFGTPPGRIATIYIAVPFGGAVVILEGLKHLFDKIYGVDHGASAESLAEASKATANKIGAAASHLAGQPTHFLSWFDPANTVPFILGIVLLGAFLCGMIHVRPFRMAVVDFIKSAFMGVRRLVYDLPRWFWKHEFLRKIFRSRPMRWLRRHVLYPLIFTATAWLLLPQLGLYERPAPLWGGVIFLAFALALNSRAGRDLEELTTERLYQAWNHIRVKWFIALFEVVTNFFKRVLETFERFMYAVDELLRFRSGQNLPTLVVKAVLGFVWAIVAFFVRAIVTLLIEPQINPIKHFPVVTVSHKFLVPLSPVVYRAILPFLGHDPAIALTGVIIFLTPGIFGFLVWEFKENWKLYAANRKAEPQTRPRRQPRRDDDPPDEARLSFGDDSQNLPQAARDRPHPPAGPPQAVKGPLRRKTAPHAPRGSAFRRAGTVGAIGRKPAVRGQTAFRPKRAGGLEQHSRRGGVSGVQRRLLWSWRSKSNPAGCWSAF